jgi:hypothetical protein
MDKFLFVYKLILPLSWIFMSKGSKEPGKRKKQGRKAGYNEYDESS